MEPFSDEPYLNFVPPPEAPVFIPNEEEWADPLAYIAKIRPVAEKVGLCKIKPPPDWQPPFAVNVDTFRFIPRIQRINELEAKSRIKLNFLDCLAKFWELQGCSLKIPHIDRKFVDLYLMDKIVTEEGGYDVVCRDRRWSRVAHRLNYGNSKTAGGMLKIHYEKIIYPYEVFRHGDNTMEQKRKYKIVKHDASLTDDKEDKEYKPKFGSFPKVDIPPDNRKSRRGAKEEPEIDYSANSEMRKLQFFGPGPKAAVPNPHKDDFKDDFRKTSEKFQLPGAFADSGGCFLQVDTYMCHTCGLGDGEQYMLLCDGCDAAYHTYCLIPPMIDVPKGDWRCPTCVKNACNKPMDPYGFEQSKKTYNLQTFGEMADQFKADYFNMPVHMVPFEKVEREFWRLVNSLEDDVVVQYGADVHALEMGSGFPTKKTKDQFPEDEEYVNSPWNLNNLAVLEQSVLCHINADISGMKIPWCYVGMCFSSFCWHIEDHWSYSINYMHWGEAKTWYGVPASAAERLEEVMRKMAPELFANSPDLLHHITTIMNPMILMSHGVPIVRTDQSAGDFVITFPRAYHAGFNQGYNFAEAVNFCPADWLPTGRECIEHYRQLKRECVFSHEELICKMAADPDILDLELAAATHQDIIVIVDRERKRRKALLEKGTTRAEREAFELLPDDERQCHYCKTTCFLSGVTCTKCADKLMCLDHTDYLCECPMSNYCLRYRYTLDELPAMMHRLKVRAESYDTWVSKVTSALQATEENKLEIHQLKELITEADEKHFPDNELLSTLSNAINEAEKCSNVANQLISKKVRTRHRQAGEVKYAARLNLDELKCFYEQIISLPCSVKESRLIKELIEKVTEFQNDAHIALTEETPDSDKIEHLIDFGITLDVELLEIPKLKQVLQQAHWLDEVRDNVNEPNSITLETMRKLLESGVALAPHPAVEKAMAELQELLTVSERWEEKARICLQARPRHTIYTLDTIVSEASAIPAYLPIVCALEEAVRKAKEWVTKVESIQSAEFYPYLDVMEQIVSRGRPIPVRLDQLPQLESQMSAAKSWRERTARTFLKKNSTYGLVEVLAPREEVGVYNCSKSRRKRFRDLGNRDSRDGDLAVISSSEGQIPQQQSLAPQQLPQTEVTQSPATIVAQFKSAEQHEIELMRELRDRNMEKDHQDDGDPKYCVCRKGSPGFMLQCELCKEWFHGTCIPLPKSHSLKMKGSYHGPGCSPIAKELKFLCPLCLRSRRPRLETILSLLVSLQKLPVRLIEGEALQCLTERSMAWQDRARQALSTPELAAALAKLSVLSQKMVEQAARKKTERIINAELMKAANNPELQGNLASVTQSAFAGLTQTTIMPLSLPVKLDSDFLTNSDQENSQQGLCLQDQSSLDSEDVAFGMNESALPMTNGGMSMEHAYSTVSKTITPGIPLHIQAHKHVRKSPLVPRQTEGPLLELSDFARAQLDELMMEGDLLEVMLDETQHIWRILQACKPKPPDSIFNIDPYKDQDIKPKLEKDFFRDKEREREEKRKRKKKQRMETELGSSIKVKYDDSGELIKIKKIKDEWLDVSIGIDKPKKKFKDKERKIKKERKEFKDKPLKSKNGLTDKLKIVLTKEERILKRRKKLKEKMEQSALLKKERKHRESKEVLIMGGDGENDEDDDNVLTIDDDCAAPKCLRPLGEEVNWVQCDGCDLWFHHFCVGLKEISVDEDYMCAQCRIRERYPPHPPGSGDEENSMSAVPIVVISDEQGEEDRRQMVVDKTLMDVCGEILSDESTNTVRDGKILQRFSEKPCLSATSISLHSEVTSGITGSVPVLSQPGDFLTEAESNLVGVRSLSMEARPENSITMLGAGDNNQTVPKFKDSQSVKPKQTAWQQLQSAIEMKDSASVYSSLKMDIVKTESHDLKTNDTGVNSTQGSRSPSTQGSRSPLTQRSRSPSSSEAKSMAMLLMEMASGSSHNIKSSVETQPIQATNYSPQKPESTNNSPIRPILPPNNSPSRLDELTDNSPSRLIQPSNNSPPRQATSNSPPRLSPRLSLFEQMNLISEPMKKSGSPVKERELVMPVSWPVIGGGLSEKFATPVVLSKTVGDSVAFGGTRSNSVSASQPIETGESNSTSEMILQLETSVSDASQMCLMENGEA